MIIKNDIPLLEYDDESLEVIAPDHEGNGKILPEKCLFTFLGDVVHEYAKKHNAELVDRFITVAKTYEIYVLHEDKEDICLIQSPIGAAAATSFLDSLISRGCKKIIATGSCGVLTELPENVFIVPTRALRAEGTSFHYQPASRYIELDKEPIAAIEKSFEKHGLPFTTCTTWTTDGFFRETRDMVKYRREEGCAVVEMECSALTACSRKRGASFGQFLFTADSLANVHEYDARDFGGDSHEKALLIGLDILRDFS